GPRLGAPAGQLIAAILVRRRQRIALLTGRVGLGLCPHELPRDFFLALGLEVQDALQWELEHRCAAHVMVGSTCLASDTSDSRVALSVEYSSGRCCRN